MCIYNEELLTKNYKEDVYVEKIYKKKFITIPNNISQSQTTTLNIEERYDDQ
jgi:hypothetical protein